MWIIFLNFSAVTNCIETILFVIVYNFPYIQYKANRTPRMGQFIVKKLRKSIETQEFLH